DDYTFWDLHVAIQDAMGWLDYHLHEFRVKGREIGIPHQDFANNILTGWEEKIGDYLSMKNKMIDYNYDFGDCWEHTVELEGIYPAKEELDYPRCLAGERACPPEDCGGVSGYYDMLDILNDPEDTEHEHILEWLGGEYNPEDFEASEVKFHNPQERLNNILYNK
ncbi:plasmid pRiA4b ORF-3 family protein, partial [Halonatronum saccharophilum]